MVKELFCKDTCPDGWTLSRFVENRLDGTTAGAVLKHVATCMHCWKKISDFADWMACLHSGESGAKEQTQAHKVWLRLQWRCVAEYFKPKGIFAAAADGQTPDDMGTVNALGSGFIHFLSRTPRGLKDGWHVKLSIPSRPTEKTILRMTVLDGTDEPISRGTLCFCRLSLPVVDGKASLSLADFQRNMNEAIVSLHREGGPDIPGDPVLGYDLMT